MYWGPTLVQEPWVLHEYIPGWAERVRLTVVIMKMSFQHLATEAESSREGKLEKTTEQHDGCLPGEEFLLGEPLSIAIGFSSMKGLVETFHKILFVCKISGLHKNYAKRGKIWGFVLKKIKTIKSADLA